MLERVQACLKRVFDVVVCSVALVVLAPLMGLIALLVWFTMGRPVAFRQVRSGRHGKPFVMYKFRTMYELHDAQGNLLPDADRLTPFGRWLRATSLDELPESFSRLRGEMSLVGPYPLLMEYSDGCHDVPPHTAVVGVPARPVGRGDR